MEVIVRGRHITVPARFRQHAVAKLAKLEKLDQKAVRIDVEVSEERNPRQSDRRERVELTIRSRGPAIRAEAAADDRYAALDLAFAKLESRLRRAADRRKVKDTVSVRSPGVLAGAMPEAPPGPGAGPPAAASEINRQRSTRLTGSTPVLGSSSTSSAGRWTIAMQKPSLRRIGRRRCLQLALRSCFSWSSFRLPAQPTDRNPINQRKPAGASDWLPRTASAS